VSADARKLAQLLAAPALPWGRKWTATPIARAADRKPLRRARGSLTQQQLASAEAFARRYSIALPMSGSARETALTMVHHNMQSPGVNADDVQKAKRRGSR
jgi:hypothetical protein